MWGNLPFVFKVCRKMCILQPLIFSLVEISMCKSSQKGNSPSQLLHGLNERNYRSRALKSARVCKNCKFWKQILKLVLKAWKETSIFHQRKNPDFLLLRDFWPWLVCICHNCQKQQLFPLAIASKPQPRHQDLAYSNATTERNFCQGSICMINCC